MNRQPPGEITDRHLEPLCVKCDNPLWSQGDDSTLTADIAHQRETVQEALMKFEVALNRCWQQSYASQLRLIVGGGLIRDAVLGELFFLRSKGTVLDFSEENRGSILIQVREPRMRR
ncbi:MAG: hypothetical protein WD071_13720 [Pseudohongiella sp.]|uniref:hypothetical protein n=1 Tax=Pseudohongiella sp. TaxID=1979412 RepID=UPI0034A00254